MFNSSSSSSGSSSSSSGRSSPPAEPVAAEGLWTWQAALQAVSGVDATVAEAQLTIEDALDEACTVLHGLYADCDEAGDDAGKLDFAQALDALYTEVARRHKQRITTSSSCYWGRDESGMRHDQVAKQHQQQQKQQEGPPQQQVRI